MTMSERDELLIKLLRMRTDVGFLTLGHISTGELQASFKGFNRSGYRVEIDKDPVEAMIRCLGPDHGQTMAELEASISTPSFDPAVQKAAARQEAAQAAQDGRMPPQKAAAKPKKPAPPVDDLEDLLG